MEIVPDYIIAGDSALFVKIGDDISEEINSHIRYLCVELGKNRLKGLREWVPSYNGVMLYFDPLVVSIGEVKTVVAGIWEKRRDDSEFTREILHVPVCYQGDFALDLEEVAAYNKMDADEVVRRHIGNDYLVYMLGFSPGFPYLGGMDKEIACPRRKEPRKLIEAGSVGIAGEQTGIYSVDSPGGWQIIGKTPLKIFDRDTESPFLLKAGMYVRFFSINIDEYNSILTQIDNNDYIPKVAYEG